MHPGMQMQQGQATTRGRRVEGIGVGAEPGGLPWRRREGWVGKPAGSVPYVFPYLNYTLSVRVYYNKGKESIHLHVTGGE